MLERMKSLIKQNKVCALATVSDNEPHCSLMSYATDDPCSRIFMITPRRTKKYRNLLANRSVCLLIDTREDISAGREKIKALTVMGTFQRIHDDAERRLALAKILAAHPHLEAFAKDPDTEVFSVEPTSFQLLDGIKDSYFETLEKS